MNTRKKGSNFQAAVRDYLIQQGYHVTISSNSRIPDIVAIRHIGSCFRNHNIMDIMFVECKAAKKLSKAERVEYLRLEREFKIMPMKAYPKYSPYSKKEGNIILKRIKSIKPKTIQELVA